MAEQPTVSIVMPAHATPRAWLQQAVTSVLAQRGCSFEFVVVDDGSPEPIADALAGFNDPRLRVIRLDHGHSSHARNVGIAETTGAYVRFVDSDDYFPPDSTTKLLELARSEPGDAIACGATRWCRDDLSPVYDLPAGCPRDAARSCLLMRCTPIHTSMLFPRSVVESVGPWEARVEVVHDWDFMLRAMECSPVVETPEVMTWYRQTPGSVSHGVDATWRGSKLTVARYFERHPEQRDSQLHREARAMLDFLSSELARPSAPWRVPAFWRALGRDPGILRTLYVRQATPRIQRLRWRAERRFGPHRP